MVRRVLFVTPVAEIGGAERSLLDLLRCLDRTRFTPEVAVFRNGPLVREIERRGIATTIYDVPRAVMTLSLRASRPSPLKVITAAFSAAATVIRLSRAIRRSATSIIHTNGLKAQLIAGVAARLAGKRCVVWHVRDFIGRGVPERILLAVNSHCADTIVANSDATRAALEARVGCPITTIHNGVDLQAFRDDIDGRPFAQELDITGKLIVGMVGMLAGWKGHHVFLAAAQRVLLNMPDVKFVIVGDEIYGTDGHFGYKAELLQLVSDLGIRSNVVFTGYRDDIPQVMASFDVLVHASVQPEPFGRVLIEAMACGKPVIATAAGGVGEIVVDGETGVLVPPNDSEAMAAAIERLLRSPETREAMGRRGRARAVEAFSARAHAAAIEDVYDSMTAVPA